MTVCRKCGRRFPKNVTRPIICDCEGLLFKTAPENSRFPFLWELEASRGQWYKLHQYAVKNKDTWDRKEVELWYYKWELGIPLINCNCRKAWKLITTNLPPNFTSPEIFFRWSVDVHNKVNGKLDKPILSYEEAQQIHGF